MSTVRTTHPAMARLLPMLSALLLVMVSPLLTGCLERSTSVGDRYSGTIVVTTTPDNPNGQPRIDLPESMMSQVSLTDFRADADNSTEVVPSSPSTPDSTPATPTEDSDSPGADDRITRVGTRVSFADLTSGQLSQLGDIVADAFDDTTVTIDLTANRSDEVVRFRGSADLTELVAGRDQVQMTITFDGPVTATNGQQSGDSSVTWSPESGKPADFTADATYADPATAAVSSWSWFVALLCLVVVGIIVWIAYRNRDRAPRPGRPTTAGTPTGSATKGTPSTTGTTSGAAKGSAPGSRTP
ncbi:DUF3153 domain-containing protein [Gordonia sp. ABSL1-1]|uniref:LppM family (lipo)protein n=1 Tax=Gordonia sp. ABSL1-1 TaxID=3053923 RepID=UPI00257371D4|nr:DUF3153 domain-containing protein [Gordonia sp. ABSL1-1]MDL9937392.1 DUF3153 domain-containing protein [Gordonia sp. ABSL1-1]